VTVHKSQGSEWDVVAHVAERWAGNDPERLHYTAVTRAARGYLRLTPVD
jgi:ATP-dependent exoDNAse (exonuclease V) alpha subunit